MNRNSGRPVLEMAALALAFAGLFLWLRAANQTPDGLSYAAAVRSGLEMFHPHHLIYVPVARSIHLVTGVDPISATLWQNLFWTVVLAMAAWRLAGKVLPGRGARLVAASALLATRGVMIYSVRVETYLPALACLTLSAGLAQERPVKRWLLVPVLALAVLYHQTNVLFVLPLLVLLDSRGPRAAARTAGLLITSGILVLVPYLLAAKAEGGGGFWAFTLNYARAPIDAWGNFDYFSPAGISQLTLSQIRMILPVREGAALYGSLAMTAALVLLAGWHGVMIRRRAEHFRLRLFSLVFLAVYLLFFLWWMPSDTDFFVATLLPLWLLGLILVGDLPPAVRRLSLGAVLVGALALGNIYFTLLPMHRDPGPGRLMALALDRAAPVEVEMITGYAVQQEMLYFTSRVGVHEGDGLVRSVLAGNAPFTGTGDEAAQAVIDGAYLRPLLARDDAPTGMFLQWLLGYDPDGMTCRTVSGLPGADGFLIGPPRRPVRSWPDAMQDIREMVRP